MAMKDLNNYIKEGFFQNTNSGIYAMIDEWMSSVKVSKDKYIIQEDGKIKFIKDVILMASNQPELFPHGKLPEYIYFAEIQPSNIDITFWAMHCNLISLKGFPGMLSSLYADNNNICNLEDCSIKQIDVIELSHNKLCNLNGFPPKGFNDTYISEIDLSYNNLTSLKGCPKSVGVLSVYKNNISSFKDSTLKEVCVLNAEKNNIYDLEGFPKTKKMGNTDCTEVNLSNNRLQFIDNKVFSSNTYKYLDISDNNLKSLAGLPENIKTSLMAFHINFNGGDIIHWYIKDFGKQPKFNISA